LISVNLGESPSQRTDFWFVPDVVVAVVVLGFWLVLRIGIDWADDVRKKREAVHLEDVKKVLSQLETKSRPLVDSMRFNIKLKL